MIVKSTTDEHREVYSCSTFEDAISALKQVHNENPQANISLNSSVGMELWFVRTDHLTGESNEPMEQTYD